MSPLSVAARLLGFCLVALLPHAPLCSAANKYAFDKWKSCEELGHDVIKSSAECSAAAKEQSQVLLQTGCKGSNRGSGCTWNKDLNSRMYSPAPATKCTLFPSCMGCDGRWTMRPDCE